MSESNNEGKVFDPFEVWRGMRNAGMDAWAKTMTEAVNTDEYAKASGALLDAYLTASIPLRELLEKAMSQALRQMNMPTRDDVISLAERMTQVEMRLDDMDAKLDGLSRQPSESAHAEASAAEPLHAEALPAEPPHAEPLHAEPPPAELLQEKPPQVGPPPVEPPRVEPSPEKPPTRKATRKEAKEQ